MQELALSCLFPVTATGCNENEADHLDRDQQPYPPSQKTKRMRTSFKHHQLRTMKSYFAINHNPDAKDLKQLAQKTGLTKRVLQVRNLLVGSAYTALPLSVKPCLPCADRPQPRAAPPSRLPEARWGSRGRPQGPGARGSARGPQPPRPADGRRLPGCGLGPASRAPRGDD